MHPAVAFGSVSVGAALFGVMGPFLAITAAAILQALVWTSISRFDVVTDELTMDTPPTKSGDGAGGGGGLRRWLRGRRKSEKKAPVSVEE